MLELKSLNYQPATAEKAVLVDINLKARRGFPIVIAGASGSGKTSLLEIISGLANLQKGKVFWKEKLLSQRERRWLCGMVFQFPERHFLGLTVGQELRLGHRRISTELQQKVLTKVGLAELDLRQSPEQLSGGQQRRLALAVQLLRKPEVLLLDEPTAGLDWSVRGEILDLLKGLAKDRLLIVVTHEPEFFRELSTQVYHLFQGRLLEKSKFVGANQTK